MKYSFGEIMQTCGVFNKKVLDLITDCDGKIVSTTVHTPKHSNPYSDPLANCHLNVKKLPLLSKKLSF